MKRAIQKHLGDFIAILALFVLGLGIGAYILSQQRLRFPLVEEKPFVVKVEFSDAQAVQPGQGQTVRTAGVEIGQIGKVELEDGRALVEMQLERKYEDYVKKDATVLLRSKTGLKDMFLEVDPGSGEPVPENGVVPSRNTAPDIDPDEILTALDADSRNYLKLLISGAGKGLKGRGGDLQETFARLGPVTRDLGRLNRGIARRRRNLSNLVNKYGLLTRELATKDREILRLVQQGNAVFEALASADQEISSAVSKLPGALRQTQRTLAKVDTFGGELGPTLEALRPPFRRLDGANRAVRPFLREATPQIRDQIRPFARIAAPYTRDLGVAARDLSRAAPDLTTSLNKLNRFFNIGAFNPNGAEGLTGNPAADRVRQEGHLYWLGWTAQNTVSLFSTASAQGPIRRIFLGGLGCDALKLAIPPNPDPGGLDPVIDLLGAAGVCAL